MQEASDRLQKMQGLRSFFQTQATGGGLLTGASSPSGVIQSPDTLAQLAYYGGGQTGVARSSERPTYSGGVSYPMRPSGGSPVTGGRTAGAPAPTTASGGWEDDTPSYQTSTPRKVGVSPQSSNYFGAESSAGWTYGSPFSHGTFTINPKTGKRKLTASAW